MPSVTSTKGHLHRHRANNLKTAQLSKSKKDKFYTLLDPDSTFKGPLQTNQTTSSPTFSTLSDYMNMTLDFFEIHATESLQSAESLDFNDFFDENDNFGEFEIETNLDSNYTNLQKFLPKERDVVKLNEPWPGLPTGRVSSSLETNGKSITMTDSVSSSMSISLSSLFGILGKKNVHNGNETCAKQGRDGQSYLAEQRVENGWTCVSEKPSYKQILIKTTSASSNSKSDVDPITSKRSEVTSKGKAGDTVVDQIDAANGSRHVIEVAHAKDQTESKSNQNQDVEVSAVHEDSSTAPVAVTTERKGFFSRWF